MQCYDKVVNAVVVSDHQSVCLSVTCRYYVKMAKCRITETMPHDNPVD